MKKFIYILTIVLSMFLFSNIIEATSGTCTYEIDYLKKSGTSTGTNDGSGIKGSFIIKYESGESPTIDFNNTLKCYYKGESYPLRQDSSDYTFSMNGSDFISYGKMICPSIDVSVENCIFKNANKTIASGLVIEKGTTYKGTLEEDEVDEDSNSENSEVNTCVYSKKTYTTKALGEEVTNTITFSLTWKDGEVVYSSDKTNAKASFISTGFTKSDFEGGCPSVGYVVESNKIVLETCTSGSTKCFTADKATNNYTGEVTEGDNIVTNSNTSGDPFDVSPGVSEEVNGCSFYLGDADDEGTVANLLQSAFTAVKIGSIALYIIFAMLDFTKSIKDDKDTLMATVNKQVKRLIILLIILMLPFFLGVLGDLISFDITCGIS